MSEKGEMGVAEQDDMRAIGRVIYGQVLFRLSTFPLVDLSLIVECVGKGR